MCGIVGQLRPEGLPVEPDVPARMCAGLEHRGPDARGIHEEPGLFLGIQRLRVIDLDTGDQPIYNEDRSVVVVLNGEIYNFAELRRDLRARGHRFATNGDTEVIAHLYEEHGVDCVRHLHGMFAFALWDRRRRRLLVARDRVGKKPLVYAHRDGGLSFASEVGALLADPEIPREVDPVALDRYLALGYVPTPLTAIAGVRKLPPAHEEFEVRPEAIDVVPRMVRHYGEPFADSSAIPSFYLAQLTRRHVTVALNGDGGDESFGGYTRYVANALAGRLDRVPAPLRRLAAAAGTRLPAGGEVSSVTNRARRLAGTLALDGPALVRAVRLVVRRGAAHVALRPLVRRRGEQRRRGGDRRRLGRRVREARDRQDAAGRRPDLPGRRPARQGRHRHHGPRPGGAVATATTS